MHSVCDDVIYCVRFSFYCAGQLSCIESLLRLGHPVTAAGLRYALSGTL